MPIWLATAAKAIGVKGFVSIGLAIALAVCWLGWSHAAKKRDELHDWQTVVTNATREASGRPKLATGEVAKQIDFLGQAISGLEQGIAARNEQIRQDGVRYANGIRQWQADSAANERKAASSDQQIARLREMAKKPGDGKCVAGEPLINGLEGL